MFCENEEDTNFGLALKYNKGRQLVHVVYG